MIAQLTGTLLSKEADELILDVHGVGYQVIVSARTMEGLPEIGKNVSLRIYTRVREDAISLIGFAETSEKDMYLLLNTVSGVGPKLALAILSGISVDELCEAIRNKNISRLTALSGVGKKTAQRLCMELKDKVGSSLAGSASAAPRSATAENDVFSDAVSALMNLGYTDNQVWQVVTELRRDAANAADLSLEELIRQALGKLA